ncbi:MAG TPA: sigma-70 family RNA polymerase sigma factor [Pyrinomonadaceae bacterium]|nr:sigma-70 family RNA polymerase sigma factor [Pyrinomonadaceae bacterium]
MSGEDFQEEAVLAAVKTLKTANSTLPEVAGPKSFADGSASFGETPMTDSSTIAGSPTLEGFFKSHHDRVFRTAYRVTGSAADAEDVLQTVFLRLARGPESPGIGLNPQAYFTRAAINASLDLLRSRKRTNAVGIDDVENRASLSAFVAKQNPETHHEDRELRQLVRDAVSKLGATAGQMFALRYFEGFDNGEIARLMGTSALVVGVTLHRARARLRKEIGVYLQRHRT